MKRICVIIGSPLHESSQAHLPGVLQDMENYKSYFESSIGGAWIPGQELYTVKHPTTQHLNKIQRLCADADLAIIVYSGHGSVQGKDYMLNFSDNLQRSFNSIITTAKRQITIVDACRVEAGYSGFSGISGLGLPFDITNPALSRRLYMERIAKAPLGRTFIFSCLHNQYSRDTENGGKYSVSLLSSIYNWSLNHSSVALSASDAFKLSKDSLSKMISPKLQTPEIHGDKQLISSIPLAVNPIAFLKGTKVKSQNPKPQKKSETNYAGPILLTAAGLLLLWGLSGD